MFLLKTAILLLVAIPPLPPPHPSTVEKLSRLPDKVETVQKDVEVLKTKSGIEITLEIPETSGLVRIPGPSYTWPHGGCYMCLGNYLITRFGQSKEYLDSIGYENWGILYDNLHNDPQFEGVKGSNEGYYYGNSGYSYQRRGIVGRVFRR